MPRPDRGFASFYFKRAVHVVGIEVFSALLCPHALVLTTRFARQILQHQNGVSAIEGFVGDSPDDLTSIGTTFTNRGDVSGGSQFGEWERSTFTFPKPLDTRTKLFKMVIRRTPLAWGYAYCESAAPRMRARDSAARPRCPSLPLSPTACPCRPRTAYRSRP